MDNLEIAGLLQELATCMEYLEEPYKAKAYCKAAQTVLTLRVPARELVTHGTIIECEGIGTSIAALLKAWVIHGDFSALEDVRCKVPVGLAELLKVPGFGSKKIKALHTMGITTLEELAEACDSGALTGLKGFSERHIARIRRAVDDIIAYRGRFLLDTGLSQAEAILDILATAGLKVELAGVCRRGRETFSQIDILVQETRTAMQTLDTIMGQPDIMTDQSLTYLRRSSLPVTVHSAPAGGYAAALFLATGSPAHTERIRNMAAEKGLEIRPEGLFSGAERIDVADEQELYARLGLQYIPPEIRESGQWEIDLALGYTLPRLVSQADIVGTLHNHTTYSDGKARLKDLAAAAQDLGYAWIGIADHSISARYAGGLNLKALKKQQAEIDALNTAAGITVLKGTECDIQPDGSLDYPDDVLETMDFTVASIHTHMDMDADSMTDRIVKALHNPHTSILGHPTGRLLLSRASYAVHIQDVLEEALRQGVVIELNAHPWRLDLDWRLIRDFTMRGGLIAIGPDAHELAGLDDMRYGIMMARKGMLTPERCINTYALDRVRAVLKRWK